MAKKQHFSTKQDENPSKWSKGRVNRQLRKVILPFHDSKPHFQELHAVLKRKSEWLSHPDKPTFPLILLKPESMNNTQCMQNIKKLLASEPTEHWGWADRQMNDGCYKHESASHQGWVFQLHENSTVLRLIIKVCVVWYPCILTLLYKEQSDTTLIVKCFINWLFDISVCIKCCFCHFQ